MPKFTSRALVLALALAGAAAHATSSSGASGVVWNQGFGTGPTGLDWSDQADGQNMADSVTLAHATAITGYNFYTASDLSGYTGSGDFQLKVYASRTVHYAGGQSQVQPGQLLMSENLGFSGLQQVCSACVLAPSDFSDPNSPLVPSWDAFELQFNFAPIALAANTTYWIGLSGNGFDADMVSVWNVQDGAMAQFSGDEFQVIASGDNGTYPVGDQMFQLVGAATASSVPEPANLALLAAGLAVVGFGARRHRRG